MFRRVLFLLPWLVIAYIEAPALVPEAWTEDATARRIVFALRAIFLCATAYAALRGRGVVTKPMRSVLFGVLAVAGWVLVFMAVSILPRTRFDDCAKGALAEIDACHFWVMGFAPDIPYYGLAKGPLTHDFCERFHPGGAWADAGTLTVHGEPHELSRAPCPPTGGEHCYGVSWRTPNGSDYWVAVAADADCTRGVYFDGRGTPARARWQRLRGI